MGVSVGVYMQSCMYMCVLTCVDIYFQVCEADVLEQPLIGNHHPYRILSFRCDDLDDYLFKVSLGSEIYVVIFLIGKIIKY